MKLTNSKIINNYCASINLIDAQPPLTVHGWWAGGTPHDARTRDHESGGRWSGFGVRFTFKEIVSYSRKG